MDALCPPTLDDLCVSVVKLPSAPALLPQLMAALHKMEGTAGEIERIIRLDSALAAATLRLANSAACGACGGIDTIEGAIVMLGHKEIYRLASLNMVSRWEMMHQESLPWEPGEYSRRALCTALAAEVIAEAGERGDPQVAYTAGLVCDLGKLALAYACPEFYPLISACAKHSAGTWADAEVSVLGYDQTEVGARLLRAWRFPDSFAQAVELLARPADSPAALMPFVALLHAARFLAVSLGSGVTEGGYLFALNGAFLAEQGLTSEFLEEAMLEVRARAHRRLSGRLRQGMFNASQSAR